MKKNYHDIEKSVLTKWMNITLVCEYFIWTVGSYYTPINEIMSPEGQILLHYYESIIKFLFNKCMVTNICVWDCDISWGPYKRISHKPSLHRA